MKEEVDFPLHRRQRPVAVVHLQGELTLSGHDHDDVVDQNAKIRQLNLVELVALGQQSGQAGEIRSHIRSPIDH